MVDFVRWSSVSNIFTWCLVLNHGTLGQSCGMTPQVHDVMDRGKGQYTKVLS